VQVCSIVASCVWMYSIIIMGAWLRYEQLLLLAHNVRTRRRRKEGRKEDIVEDPWNNSELTDCREARSCSCKQKDGYRRGDLKVSPIAS